MTVPTAWQRCFSRYDAAVKDEALDMRDRDMAAARKTFMTLYMMEREVRLLRSTAILVSKSLLGVDHPKRVGCNVHYEKVFA